MPLDASGLNSALNDLFSSPPADRASCAQAWADAMNGYTSGVIPASTTVTAAASALAGALDGAFASQAAAPAMENAFTAFALTVAGGMAGAGFAGVPPAGPVGFASLLSVMQPSHASAAAAWANLIDVWMHEGTATLIAPPNTPVTWT